MSRVKVSNLVRVRQGRNCIEFELVEETGKLNIAIIVPGDTTPDVKASINKEAVDVLRELLGLRKARDVITPAIKLATKLATKLPPDTAEEVPADSDKGSDFKAGMA